MSEAAALTRAVQDAISATETQAQLVLSRATRVLGWSMYLGPDTEREVGISFAEAWKDLCRSLRDFCAFYIGRSYGKVFIPARLRPHDFLAGVAQLSSKQGVSGRSLSQIVFKYGGRVRQQIRQAVSRTRLDQSERSHATLSPLVVTRHTLPPDSLGGYYFPIPDGALPAVGAALREFPVWDAATVESVEIGLSQECARAWQSVPALIQGMYRRSDASLQPPVVDGPYAELLALVRDPLKGLTKLGLHTVEILCASNGKAVPLGDLHAALKGGGEEALSSPEDTWNSARRAAKSWCQERGWSLFRKGNQIHLLASALTDARPPV